MNQQDPPAGLGYPPPPTQYPTQGYPPPGFYGYTPAPPPPPKKTHRVRTIVLSVFATLVVVFIALVLIGSAMNSAPTPTRSTAPVPTQQAPAPAAPAPTQAPTTVPQNTQDAQPRPYGASDFGSYVETDNDMTVFVSTPQDFSPSATSAGYAGLRAFATDVTVRNGTGQPLNPMMINVNASVDGQEAESVFDSAQGIGLPTTTILPGRSVTYRAVFSSPVEHGQVQVDVTTVTSTATFTGHNL